MASAGTTRIDIRRWSHVKLRRELASNPERILPEFKRHNIGCLMDVPVFQDILIQLPAIAVKIALLAANMGIKIGDEDIDQGDVLASMKPGDV